MSIPLSRQKGLLGRGIPAFLLCAALTWVVLGRADAYLMPAKQLVGLMMANFSKMRTLVIAHTVHLSDSQDQDTETVLEERIWLKSPGLFHAELMGRLEGQDSETRISTDMVFRRLLMANDGQSIMTLLSEMGITQESMGFTRFKGTIAYRIGDKDPKSPKLLVEKERFLPLFVAYWAQGEPGHKMVSVQFDDYRKLAEGWYPYEISYRAGEEIAVRYVILDAQVNVPVDFSHLRSTGKWTHPPQGLGSAQESQEEERLREAIQLLKDKYPKDRDSD